MELKIISSVRMTEDEETIGFAAGKRTDDDHYVGELYALYVSQKCRGLGVGRQLVSATAKHFKENGIHSMLVWVMEQNKAAVIFYEWLGGMEYRRRKSEFGGTVVGDISYGRKDLYKFYRE